MADQRHGVADNSGDVYRHIWIDLLAGLLVTFGLLGFKMWLEHTWIGESLDLVGYHSLQDRLLANFQGDDFPIQILDIGNLPAVYKPGAPIAVTPRDRLFKLIEAVVAQKPLAVGVDIDFSPTTHGFRDPEKDPGFFGSVAALGKRTGIPVFLGVADSAALPPKDWLPGEYPGLAACILIPTDDDRRMVEWIRSGDSEPGPTLSSALAKRVARKRSKKHFWAWALEESAIEKLSEGRSVGKFTVDYSPLKTLEHDKLQTISPQSVAEEGSRFKKKIVLIGDATRAKTTGGDLFQIPGRGLYPGIYVHACAAYTLIRDPLYELTAAGRIFLDLLISLLALWPVFAIRRYYAKMKDTKVAVPRVQLVFTWAVAIGVFFAGRGLVARWGIMWTDFLAVFAFLVLHPAIERYLDGFVKWARKAVPAAWKALVLDERAREA